MNFFSDLSLWWLIPMAILAVGISILYYRSKTNQVFDKKKRSILTIFRGTSLFLLFLILVNLVWETLEYRKEKPLVITMIDQSASIKNFKDSNTTKKQLISFKKQLEKQFGDRFEFIHLALGSEVSAFKRNQFSESETNLAAGFEHIRETYFNRNIGAVILASDGKYNRGIHPMYEAERLELTPVFTLGIGDSTPKKDALVRSVNSNEVAFLNQQFPVQGIIEFNKIPIGPVRINLLNNGKIIQSQTIRCDQASFDQKEINFLIEAKAKGFQRFTITVEQKNGEVSFKNNSASTVIEIVDNKSNILCLSSAPHPDILAIRSVLEEDPHAKIESALTSSYSLKSKPNLVVWYENGTKPNASLFNSLTQQGIPIFLILGPSANQQVISSYDLGLKIPAGNQTEDIYPASSSSLNSFEFSAIFTNVIASYLPLRTRFGSFTLPNDAEIVLKQRIGSIVKKDALVYFSKRKKSKLCVVLGEGLWRWKIKEYTLKKDIAGFREFVQKSTQFILVNENLEPLRVNFPKRVTKTEDIDAKAEFYNESMELITIPEISLTINRKGQKEIKQFFTPSANFYTVNIGKLPAGTYSWFAKASYKGKTVSKQGDFVVEDVSLESLDNVADFGTLNQLSKQSGGSFYLLKDFQKLVSNLNKRSDIAAIQYADSGYKSLIDWWLPFILLLLLLSSEWFLRRFWGAY